mmetsp:Transcript_3380/g.7735  ORF Transcript_3380/g.7735 Transcript_3380/m.7735 type:complete len:271 (+) Transcript_3380:986-1798(+)
MNTKSFCTLVSSLGMEGRPAEYWLKPVSFSIFAAIVVPIQASIGVPAMDSATVVSSSLLSLGEIMPEREPMPIATKASSPPCAVSRPVRCAAARLTPNSLATSVVMVALPAIMVKSMARMVAKSVRIRPRSMEKPTVMKNRPSSRPRKGAMSASTWYRYEVSESSRPARNAPSVSDSPMPEVTKLMSRTVDRITLRKASCDPLLATRLKTGFRSFLPIRDMVVRVTMALTAAIPRALPRPAPPLPSSSTTISSGTTARSCSSSTPKDARP